MRSVIGRLIDRSMFVWFRKYPELRAYDETKVKFIVTVEYEEFTYNVTYGDKTLFQFVASEGLYASINDNLHAWQKLMVEHHNLGKLEFRSSRYS